MATIKTVKAPNYTAEQVSQLVAGYIANPTRDTVNSFAEKFGKNVRSVIAKLTREGVYQAAKYETKKGEKPVKKDETADAIGVFLNLSDAETDSLTKANKTALVKILAVVAKLAKAE